MWGRKLFLLVFPPVSPGSLGTFFCVCEEVMKEAGEMDFSALIGCWGRNLGPGEVRKKKTQSFWLCRREPGLEMKTASPHPEPRFPSQLLQYSTVYVAGPLGLVRGSSWLLELASSGSSLGPLCRPCSPSASKALAPQL